MPTTYTTLPLDGSTQEFTIPFEYLTRKFVTATLIGATRKPLVLNVDFRFVTPTKLSTNVVWGPGDGYDTIEIRRNTSATERLVNFNDGSILRAGDLNISQVQAIHIAEEGRDISSQALLNNLLSWDAINLRIRNVADPISPQDAATKSYVDALSVTDGAYLEKQLGRTIRGTPGESLTVMPPASSRANKVLGFDSLGQPLAVLPLSGSGTELALDLANNTDANKGAGQIGFSGDQPTVSQALYSRAKGNPGKSYNLIGGTFRKDLLLAPTWRGIFDNAHISSLMTEPDEVGTQIRLNHATGDATDICTMMAAADETFAAAGVMFGSSVNKDYSLVSGGAPVDFTVDLSDPYLPIIPIIKDNRLFGDQRFTANVANSGLITIGHPQVQLKKNPEIQYMAPSSAYQFVTPHYSRLASPGQTTLFLLARMSGRISWNGTTWGTVDSPFNALVTAGSYDATLGELTITHPGLTDNSMVGLTNYASSGGAASYDVTLVGANKTTFIVRFRKKLDDTIPPSIPPGVGFTFDRGQSAILPKSAISGYIGVFLDVVQLDLRDVNWPNANIWAFGMMGKKNT